ncbi:MAG: SxtJ family membrane protein [Verrucomicrobiota bacterium]
MASLKWKSKLKDNVREWRKFTLVWVLAIALLAFWNEHRGRLSPGVFVVVLACLGIVAVWCWLRPQDFRKPYRWGMTFNHHVGQLMGKVMLTVIYLLLLTPLGLLLRVLGKDLLSLRPPRNALSYWQKSKLPGRFDRQF